MATDNKNNDDRIARLLKKLAPVKASDDFEMRLKRRILATQTRENKKSKFRLSEMFSNYPLPAYSFSVFTIIALGVLSYYTFFRTGITPTQTISTIPDIANVEPESSSELSTENIQANENKNGILQDTRNEQDGKVFDSKKQTTRSPASELKMKESEETTIPTASQKEIISDSRSAQAETGKANRTGHDNLHLIEMKKSDAKQVSVPSSKQQTELLQSQVEKAKSTFIDSTSRIDTSRMDSLKKFKL